MRRLSSSNNQVARLYLSKEKTKIEDHKTFPKLKKLMSTWDSLSLSDRSTALGSIDNKLYQIFISSENNSRKNSIVLAPNSPGLSTLGTT